MSRFGYSPEELALLRQAFFEEAREQLEAIAAAGDGLRAAAGGAPREEVTEAVTRLLRELHTLKGSAATVELDVVAQAAHALEDRVIALRDAGRLPGPAALERLLRDCEGLRDMVHHLAAPRPLPPGPVTGRRSVRPREERAGTVPAERSGRATLRVEVERVDELIDAMGEMVIARTRIARRLQELRDCARDLGAARRGLRTLLQKPLSEAGAQGEGQRLGPGSRAATADAAVREIEAELGHALMHLERAVGGMAEDADRLRLPSQVLQEGLQRVRMMRVGQLLRRMEAPLREMARRSDKQIEVFFEGEETRIDKSMVERVADPLLHLVRNAVAHGIETSARRRALGKPETGRIRLGATQRGSQILITVSDDGAGIDRERVRAALVRGGRMGVAAAAGLDDAAVCEAIFLPGVSTREAVDDLAGRGMGLDAVREAIVRLGGDVAVESTPGAGTRFVVRLPLTTAILQALLFKVGGQVYAVPVVSVIETAQVSAPAVERGPAGEWITVREERLPLVRLGALLGVPPPPGAPDRRWAVVVEHDELRFAITCDKVIGAREIVIKSLGPLLAPLRLFAGATISGAGKVQLILDLGTLATIARAGKELGARPRAGAVRRILVVDDSRTLREAAALLLQQGGYQVELATDGWDAWDLLQDQPFDLLLTDLEMPRIDGWELLGRIRRHPNLRDLSVLIMSSRTGEAHRQRALGLGADDFIGKPLRRRVLLDAVRAALDG
ncbi:MAG TPA: response regulator [Polyangia bacterium]|nr:response regulator [Polyangia bacterium]